MNHAVEAVGDANLEAKGASAPLSLRAFARLIGVNEKAVRRAVQSGRLTRSLGRDAAGRVVVVDIALARIEWQENAGKPARIAAQPADRVASAPSAPSAVANKAHAQAEATLSLVDAQRDTTVERARKLRLENDLKEGRLVDVVKASKEAFEAARIIREAILNIPARLSAELAAEPDAGKVYQRLDSALRAALESTSQLLMAAGE